MASLRKVTHSLEAWGLPLPYDRDLCTVIGPVRVCARARARTRGSAQEGQPAGWIAHNMPNPPGP